MYAGIMLSLISLIVYSLAFTVRCVVTLARDMQHSDNLCKKRHVEDGL